jgi:hypothetical protein
MRYLPHVLGAINGTTNWKQFELVVPVLPETRLLCFIIDNGGHTGQMFTHNITVDEVSETALYGVLKIVAVTLRVLVALWAA